MRDDYPPPEHLSDRRKQLSREVAPSRARTIGRHAVLQYAPEALDRADQCRTKVASAGLTTTTKTTGAVHIHPLLKAEREARQQFARIWSDLSFGWDQRIDGRSSHTEALHKIMEEEN